VKSTSPPIRTGASCTALLLAAVLAATACRRETETPSSDDAAPTSSRAPPAAPAPETPSEAAVAQLLAPWTGDLDGMIERRYVRMLVTFSRTNYFLDKAEQRGITYEMGKLFEAFLNERLKSKQIRVHVAFIPVSRDRLLAALAEGRGDIAAANLTITPERLELVDFATPFASDVREVVVTAADQPPLADATELSGREVHVRRSSSYYASLVALNETLKGTGRAPVVIVEASEALEDEDNLEMVNAGLIPATVVDSHVAALWDGIFDQIRVHREVAIRTGGEIAWALRRDTPQLREVVNEFAAANAKGSLNFNMLFRRYFKDNKWVKNAASEAELRKFRQAADFFRRYGDQYDLPWLLVAAQAYQESQIEQSLVSRAGAVGVMQIKPSTAAGAPIHVTGVKASMERNIEAGAKYLRFIVDEYYKDEPMDQLDKGLFAIASYNAGPARVAQLRRKAEAMGLDPNKWFGNVEVVAAREIGAETVQYVSNIYKYYVSYTLIAKQMEARRQAR
jgi:membrane-bound lytic murein transglycosylase MltF